MLNLAKNILAGVKYVMDTPSDRSVPRKETPRVLALRADVVWLARNAVTDGKVWLCNKHNAEMIWDFWARPVQYPFFHGGFGDEILPIAHIYCTYCHPERAARSYSAFPVYSIELLQIPFCPEELFSKPDLSPVTEGAIKSVAVARKLAANT